MKRAVTMGNFDGCHLGHQALFRTLKAVAEVNHLQPTVISFEPHSNYVLRGPGDPLLLTTTEEKREFVESLGIEFLVLPFTHELAKLPFDKFVRTELIEKREVVSMFFGHDHCFGAGGKGNYETITAAFPELSTQMLSTRELFCSAQCAFERRCGPRADLSGAPVSLVRNGCGRQTPWTYDRIPDG